MNRHRETTRFDNNINYRHAFLQDDLNPYWPKARVINIPSNKTNHGAPEPEQLLFCFNDSPSNSPG